MYTDLSSSKVLVMEWVDGARLNDEGSMIVWSYTETLLQS